MHRKRANQFEAYLQRAAQDETADGDLASLASIARSVSAVHVPPPPRGLHQGRRRLVAEAARLSRRRSVAWHLPLFTFSKMRTAAVVLSLLVVVALLPGLTHAIATSTGDSPLYPLKLLGQEARLWLTNNPTEVADLQVAMAEEQLDVIATSLEQGRSIDPATADRAQMRLSLAVDAISQSGAAPDPEPKLRLMNAIQNTHQRIMGIVAAGVDAEQEPLHNLMRQMERARQELHAGNGQPEGEQERAREGTPPEDQDFGDSGPAGSAPGAQATPGAVGPAASDPGPASGPGGNQAGRGPSATPTPALATPEPTTAPDPHPGLGGSQPQSPHAAGENQSRNGR